MAGKGKAVSSGNELQDRVVEIGKGLGLDAREQVKVGKRIWGADRHIDVVLTETKSRKSLGVECKFQGGGGSAEEKIPTTVQDIEAWPIKGIVVLSGEGFSSHMRSFLYSTGRAVDIDDLEDWLKLYFGL